MDEAKCVQAVEHALRHVRPGEGLTVVVNDPQRATATADILALLAEQVDPGRTRLLVATGSHRFGPAERKAFEQALAGGRGHAEIAWHDCRSDDLVGIGPGRPWRGHRWLLERPAVLAVGSVEPHYFAGFTGAHKTLTIGCASHRDITENHSAALASGCRPCRLDGNGVFAGIEAMLSALRAVRPAAAIDLVQKGEKVLAAFGGRAGRTLAAAAAAATRHFVRRITAPADALVAEVSGPLGETFYQADKGIKNNEFAVRDGGAIVLVAPCRGGVGQDQFLDLLRQAPTHEEALAVVGRRGYRLGDHKAVRLRRLTDPAGRAVRLAVVAPGLSVDDAALLGARKADSVAEALDAAGVDAGRHDVCRVADAGNCVVLVGQD